MGNSSGYQEIAVAIGTAEEATIANQNAMAYGAIDNANALIQNQVDWLTTINEDGEDYYLATTEIPADPSKAALAASYSQQEEVDTTNSDNETGEINTIIETQKTQVGYDGQNMSNIYAIEEPITAMMDAVLSLITRL